MLQQHSWIHHRLKKSILLVLSSQDWCKIEYSAQPLRSQKEFPRHPDLRLKLSLHQGALMIVNGIAILNNERFLEKSKA